MMLPSKGLADIDTRAPQCGELFDGVCVGPCKDMRICQTSASEIAPIVAMIAV